MFPFPLMLCFWVSFCFASFLPLKSDIPGWVVCLSLSLWLSWHGDVLCFALSVVSYQHTSQWGRTRTHPGTRKLNSEAWVLCSLPQTAEGMFCMVTSKWLPHHDHCQVRTILRLCLHLYSLSLLSSPPTNQGLCQCTPPCALAKLVLSDVSHTTQGSGVAYPEMLILGA